MNIKIQKALPNNLEEIYIVESSSFPREQAASKESLKERLETKGYAFYAAEADGKIIGILNGPYINDDFMTDELYDNMKHFHNENNPYLSIFGLAVLKDYRNMHAASLLMKYALEECRKLNKKGVVLACLDKMVKFYESFGYADKGISKSVHGNVQWHDMLKIL